MNSVDQFNHIFCPKTVAVVGASVNPDKVGFLCLSNLLESGFKGRIYPVNPGLEEVLGLKAYPSVSAIPGEVDLALIAIPAAAAVSAVVDCAAKGVQGVVLVSSGFGELGTEMGAELQNRVKDISNRNGIRIVGPNTIGLINPGINLNATFVATLSAIKGGRVALAAQSGGMLSLITQSLSNHNVGISKASGLGNQCDVNFGDLLAYFAEDDETKVITLYIEGLAQPRQFISIARQVVKRKPILALKGGRHEQANQYTRSHTGALAGRYELYQAAFAQAGIITVDDISELVDTAKALAYQPPAAGNRIAIVSAMGGPSIVMADRCHELGLKLAEFSADTWQRLRQLVPALTTVDNPVDIAWTTNDFDTSLEILKAIIEDSGVDAIAVCVTATDYTTGFTRAVIEIVKSSSKPITMCTGPRSEIAESQTARLEENGIPTYALPERAVTGISGLVRYGEILRANN